MVVLAEGVHPAAIIASAAGWGAWPQRWLYRGPGALRRFLIATALGLGFLAPMTLGLGVLGILNRPTAWSLLAVGGVLGLVRLARSGAAIESNPNPASPSIPGPARARPGDVTRWTTEFVLLLPLAWIGAILLYCATLPPGLLWDFDGNGYDVLEYHLQVPREYFEAGRIQFLQHNVYASFPQQTESLYLLLMHMLGDSHLAAIPAQLLHAALGVLAVLTLAAWSPAGWPRLVAVLTAGTAPWLAIVGCLAYVEMGLLYFSAVAGALVVECLENRADDNRVTILAGLCAGWAGAVKYTGLVLVLAALAGACLLIRKSPIRRRLSSLGSFLIAGTAAASPWLLRNAAFTGNPVYPFAYGLFGGTGWSPEQAEQWARGHHPAEGIGPRLRVAWNESIASPAFGPSLFIAAALGLVIQRDRASWLLALWSLLMIAAWMGLTHMPGRFLAPLIVPMALMAARGAAKLGSAELSPLRGLARFQPAILVAPVVAGALWNAQSLRETYAREAAAWIKNTGVPLKDMVDQVAFMQTDGEVLNHVGADPARARLWIVGQAAVYYVTTPRHYSVVFNRDPWVEYAASGVTAEESVAWLAQHEVTHLVVCWPEVERLRRSYGFAEVVTPEWMAQLEQAGLRRCEIRDSSASRNGYQAFEVPDVSQHNLLRRAPETRESK